MLSVRRAYIRGLSVLGLCGVPCLSVAGAQVPRWSLAHEPAVSIEGFADTLLLAGIVGATMLRDGSIIVADDRLFRIMKFSGEGKPLVAAGRRGGGPGEFQTISWLGACETDTLSLFDPGQDRVSRFDVNTRLVDTRRGSPQGPVAPAALMGRSPYSLRCGPAGTFVSVGWPARDAMVRASPGPYRTTVTIAIARGPHSAYTSLGQFPGPERYRFKGSDGPRPYGKKVHTAISRSRVYIGSADSFYVEIFDFNGRRRGVIKRDVPLKPFRPMDKAFDLRRITPPGSSKEQMERARKAVDEIEYPEFLPAYASLMVDDSNHVWIEETHSAGDAERRWWIFSEGGVFVATLSVPPQFTLFEVRNSRALGLWSDTDGTGSVRSYQLRRKS